MELNEKIYYQWKTRDWNHPFISEPELKKMLASVRYLKWCAGTSLSGLVVSLKHESAELLLIKSEKLRKEAVWWVREVLSRDARLALSFRITASMPVFTCRQNAEFLKGPMHDFLDTETSKQMSPLLLWITEETRSYIRKEFVEAMCSQEMALVEVIEECGFTPQDVIR